VRANPVERRCISIIANGHFLPKRKTKAREIGAKRRQSPFIFIELLATHLLNCETNEHYLNSLSQPVRLPRINVRKKARRKASTAAAINANKKKANASHEKAPMQSDSARHASEPD
jgi:hypothetical protein